MALSDKRYDEIMKLNLISEITEKLKWHMLNKPIDEYIEKKVEANKDKREHLEAIEILKNLIGNDTLLHLLWLKKKKLVSSLDYFKRHKKQYIDGKRVRIEKHFRIDELIVALMLRLHLNGIIQSARKVDFVYRYISENNLYGYKFDKLNQKDEEYEIRYTYKMNEQSIRRKLRKLNKRLHEEFH